MVSWVNTGKSCRNDGSFCIDILLKLYYNKYKVQRYERGVNEMSDRKTVTAKMKDVDWNNLEIVRAYYRDERGLDLKDSSVFKMLLADKASEIKAKG